MREIHILKTERESKQQTERKRGRERERDDSLLAFCSIRVSEVEL